MNIGFLISGQILMKAVETFFPPAFSPVSFTCVPSRRAHLVAFGPRPPRWKVTEFHRAAWGRHVSGRWLMQHVEPCETAARCPCVSLPGGRQHRWSVPYKSFHALSPSKLANSCIFHQKWFFEIFFFSFFWDPPEWGCLDSTWKLGGCRKRYSLSTGLLATQSWMV